jgi:hypothetical protein
MNNVTLKEISPPTFAAHAIPPALSSDQVADLERTQGGDSFGMMQPDMHLPFDQYYFAAEQGNTFAQQEYVQSFNNSPAIPQYSQYEPLPIQSSLDNGYQQAMWEYSLGVPQNAPAPMDSALDYGGHHGGHHGAPVGLGQYQQVIPFNQQVEDQDWDLSLADHPSACGSTSEQEWNPFV